MGNETCIVKGCGSQRGKTDTSFHCLPSCITRREQWIQIILQSGKKGFRSSLKAIVDSSTICGLHFSSECYSGRLLKKTAAPSIFPSDDEEWAPPTKIQKVASACPSADLGLAGARAVATFHDAGLHSPPIQQLELIPSSLESAPADDISTDLQTLEFNNFNIEMIGAYVGYRESSPPRPQLENDRQPNATSPSPNTDHFTSPGASQQRVPSQDRLEQRVLSPEPLTDDSPHGSPSTSLPLRTTPQPAPPWHSSAYDKDSSDDEYSSEDESSSSEDECESSDEEGKK